MITLRTYPEYTAIIFDIGDVLFSYNMQTIYTQMANADPLAFTPIPQGIDLVHACHKQKLNGKNIRLFILSNFTTAGLTHLLYFFPDFFALFDDILISGATGFAKPDRQAYAQLLNKHALKPQDTIFIDDKQGHIDAACSLGITGLVYRQDKDMNKELCLLGVLQ